MTALRIKLQHERLRALLAQMDAEFGPVPAEALDRARSTFLSEPSPRRAT